MLVVTGCSVKRDGDREINAKPRQVIQPSWALYKRRFFVFKNKSWRNSPAGKVLVKHV